MKKKRLIIAFVVVAMVAMTSWFVYPRYKLYRFLEEEKRGNALILGYSTSLDFTNYFDRFYHYPESSEDSVFAAPFYEHNGFLHEPYSFGVFLREDTINDNGSIENVFKLYLKGPNHNEKHVGKIINSIDYENGLITPVDMPFYKFLFSKGDILISILESYNPCDRRYSNFAYKEKLNLHDTIVQDSFRRTIAFPYREKYGSYPTYIRDFYDDTGLICYEANLYSDTLILTQVCEPFNGEYDTSPMAELLNKPIYTWAKEIGLRQFFFSIEVRASFFEKKPLFGQSSTHMLNSK